MTTSLKPPTLASSQRALMLSENLPAREWVGRCHEVCRRLLDASDTVGSPVEGRLEGARIQRGRWVGERAPDAAYPPQADDGHTWLVLSDGRIWDPTCWAFTGRQPHLTVAGPEDARWEVARPGGL